MATGPHIAIVDDDVSLREALTGLLNAYGFSTTAYASAQDLLDSRKLADYAVFILDVQMPSMDGLQLQGEIAKAGVGAPVIFLTSAQDAETRERAMAQGAAAFLGKPFQGGELLTRVAEALDSSRAS